MHSQALAPSEWAQNGYSNPNKENGNGGGNCPQGFLVLGAALCTVVSVMATPFPLVSSIFAIAAAAFVLIGIIGKCCCSD